MIQALPSPAAVLERNCEQRSESGYLEQVQGGPDHRIVLFRGGRALVASGGLAFLEPAAVDGRLPAGTVTVYLGQTIDSGPLPAGTHLVLKVFPDDAGELPWVPAGTFFSGYRDVGDALGETDAAIFIEAQAVANWHRSHRFCPRCGAPTVPEHAGWMRRCTEDGSEHFPRTDPAAIVAVVGADGRILLASNFAWEPNRYSTVAGFIEAGESAEQGAVREIAEEVGVHLHSTHYVGSQAWPFPRSLMLGFVAYTDDTLAIPDGTEVREARWFSRDELQAAVLSGEAIISRRLSIARALIEHWYGGTILEPGEDPDRGDAAPVEPGTPGHAPAGGRA
jgi:NAD+ diphosphatase